MQMLHFRVPTSCNGMRLNIFLRTMGVSSACIKAVKYQGTGFCVRLGDEVIPVHTDYRVATAQIVSFALPPEPPTDVQPEPLPIDVIYEDEFAAVLNKPAGIAVHPTLNHTSGTLANGWLYRLKCRGEDGVFRPVNRIDKNTSGLVLCAQNSFAAPLLADSAQKCYLAIVQGILPLGPGQVEAPIARRGDSIIGRCVREDGKYSLTRYNVLAVGTGHSLVACTPCTGRTHQIRVHMAYIGHPLAGDTLYGGSDSILSRHALHCAVLRFTHPVSRQAIRIQSELPPDMAVLAHSEGLFNNWDLQEL